MKAAILAFLLLAATPSDEVTMTATSVNVAEPGTPVRIRILRWSTDDERAPIVAALAPKPPQPAAAAAPNPNAATASAGGRGGARGRGGRGRGGPAAPLTPIAAFTAAIGRAPTIGYIWTSDITGYSIKYAWHSPQPDGSDRIVLATNRRLGAYSDAWKPLTAEAAAKPAVGVTPADYEFTVIELRLGAKGTGEGKTSLTAKVITDGDAKTVALEDYAGTLPILQNVKR
jgi:hypothetical protein